MGISIKVIIYKCEELYDVMQKNILKYFLKIQIAKFKMKAMKI